MSPPDISKHVLEFVAASIDSVPQMEALLLLWESPPRAWSVDELAARIYVTVETATGIVVGLQQRQLVRAEGADPVRWCYDPSNPNDALIADVAAAYRTHLVPLATYIHSKASQSVREFARAFDFKKDR